MGGWTDHHDDTPEQQQQQENVTATAYELVPYCMAHIGILINNVQ